MPDNTPPDSNALSHVPDTLITAGNLDVDGLKDLSRAEYEAEHGKLEDLVSKEGEGEDDDGLEDTYQGKKPKEKEEDDEQEEDDEEEEDSDEEDEEEDEEEEDSEIQEVDDKDSIAFKVGDKTIKAPKDAMVNIKVNGKVEEVPLQQVLNRASGDIHIERETSRLGQENKDLQLKKQEFNEEAKQTNDNAAMLMDLAENGSPEDFCQYYGLLTNKDPDQVLANMINRSIEYAKQFSGMTDRERLLYNENRKFKFQQALERRSQKQTTETHAFEERRNATEKALEKENLSWDDWVAAGREVTTRMEAGELSGKFTELDIVKYAVSMRHDVKVRDAVGAVGNGLGDDPDFIRKALSAVARHESLTGESLSPEDLTEYVKELARKSNKSLSENLSRKAKRHKKTGKANSKKAGSRKRKQKEDAGTLTLEDHHDKIWGDGGSNSNL